jgi:molybdenum cofactor sulfurtransferase
VGSTWRSGTRTSSRSPSTRCSVTQRARAHCSRAPGRSTASGDRGRRRHRRRGDRPERHGGAALGHARFEDGTVDYLSIPAVAIGLRHLERIGMETISRRIEGLGTWLVEALQRLRHSDGRPGARIYGPTTWTGRGGTIAFNFLHPDGRVVDERFVDLLAAAHNISIRTGCFCNPGAGEAAFGLSKQRIIGVELSDGMSVDDYLERLGMPTGGAVRVSLGLASNFADVHRFISFATKFRDLADVPRDLPPGVGC